MTKLEAIRDLRDKVKAGEWNLISYGYDPLNFTEGLLASKAFNGSVDAAIALVGAVCPAARWEIDDFGEAGIWAESGASRRQTVVDNPARAMLLCVLDIIEWEETE